MELILGAFAVLVIAGLLFWGSKAFGKTSERDVSVEAGEVPDQTDTVSPGDPQFEADLNQTYDALDAYWASIGKIDADVVTYLMNPALTGMPEWPSWTQSFSVVRTEDSLIIASRGISGPLRDDNGEVFNGFGMEVFVELPGEQDMTFDEIRSSAGFGLVEIAAAQVANWGGITGALEQYGVVSSELFLNNTSRFPDGSLTGNGGVGVLFGIPTHGRSSNVANPPFSPIIMVPVTYVTPSEVQDIVTLGEAERDRLVDALHQSGIGHKSVLGRESLQR